MKKNSRTDYERVQDILESCEKIRAFTDDLDETGFIADSKTVSAVLYQFSIIGEAVNNLSLDFIESHEFPWHKPRAFRNFVIHEYFNVSLSLVWVTLRTDLIDFEQFILNIERNFKA